ncbi:MAG: tRNA lysidine(34) synthetase TilS [Xanthomonadaceae bacterium]|nr:tRNA lysidine(34) synthetase TilS [Xanthomonadaceae bacterium]
MKIHIPARPPGYLSAPLLLGLSGGLDSIALLHLLANDTRIDPTRLSAIHVHHGLQSEADAWAAHCTQACETLNVPIRLARVDVDRHHRQGLEAAAREARYTAFRQALKPEQVLVTAHQLEDQAETFLLRALRASGPDGLACMRPWRPFASGWHWRPLLDVPRRDLLAYARSNELIWIEDPSNDSHDYDRNFLRHQVLPLLGKRWPRAVGALAQSARLNAEASDLLLEEDIRSLHRAFLDEDRRTLSVMSLTALSSARRARVLRYWLRDLGLPPLPISGSLRIESDLLRARADASAGFAWSGASIRRWRDQLHADWDRPPTSPTWKTQWDGRTPLQLPDGSMLSLHDGTGNPGASGFDNPLEARARRGGERIVLPGRRHSHSLKHALQEYGVPPWQRERIPLLSDHEGRLLAAGTSILSAFLKQWLDERRLRLSWTIPSRS